MPNKEEDWNGTMVKVLSDRHTQLFQSLSKLLKALDWNGMTGYNSEGAVSEAIREAKELIDFPR